MRLFIFIQLFAVLPYIFVSRAEAYIDPGTGSMIVQAVIAGVAMVSVSIGIFWRHLKAFFNRFFGGGRSGDDD